MWKDGAMVCRARSGRIAPPLGAAVRTDSGISGECLRTGALQHCSDTQNDKRVDAEVCRLLGLRSIAVAPIVGWHGINGILEIFSTEPCAFSDEHVTLLKQMAGLAEKARALRPHTASAIAGQAVEKIPEFKSVPASDRLRDVVFAALGTRRRLVLGGTGILVFVLLGSVIWLGLHGPEPPEAKAQAAQSVVSAAPLSASGQHDSVWKPNPGGETVLFGKPSAGTSVKLAAKLDRIAEAKPSLGRAADQTNSAPPQLEPPRQPSPEASIEPPALASESFPAAAMNDVLRIPASDVTLAVPVSQGVSNGHLLRRVSPVYPSQALQMRLQGTVRVEALISERGLIENLKVVEGSPLLARAASDAIKQWRYKPYELNGRPVKMATSITVTFTLPQ